MKWKTCGNFLSLHSFRVHLARLSHVKAKIALPRRSPLPHFVRLLLGSEMGLQATPLHSPFAKVAKFAPVRAYKFSIKPRIK